ncbi:hypothetical protein Dda_5148 [Drechslerella dactyloides]|uniref:DC-UbP/UBTD2 N-terminal domain-containing protein n=1 Tax=Drechslerella dactyloides TaxID=74499 RepID=A0AAD6NH96_DREDA|nr:hypothetical protein Dda_5148 [Drechslerella dactyloides]
MGNCLSSRKSGGQNANNNNDASRDPNSNNPDVDIGVNANDDDPAAAAGSHELETRSQSQRPVRHQAPQPPAAVVNRTSRYRHLPLSKRPDKPLRRHEWSHNINNEGRAPTRRALERMREEFWHTRVEGREEVWRTVRTVVELLQTDPSEGALVFAREILHAAEITVPSGDLTNAAYDVFGNKYKFPAYVLSDPDNLSPDSLRSSNDSLRSYNSSGKSSFEFSETSRQRRRDMKGKGPAVTTTEKFTPDMDMDLETITVRFRLSDGTDHTVEAWQYERLKDITERLMEMAGIDRRTHRIKMFLAGLLLDPYQSLENQRWQPDRIVNAIVQDLRIVAPQLVQSSRPSDTPSRRSIPPALPRTLPEACYPRGVQPPSTPQPIPQLPPVARPPTFLEPLPPPVARPSTFLNPPSPPIARPSSFEEPPSDSESDSSSPEEGAGSPPPPEEEVDCIDCRGVPRYETVCLPPGVRLEDLLSSQPLPPWSRRETPSVPPGFSLADLIRPRPSAQPNAGSASGSSDLPIDGLKNLRTSSPSPPLPPSAPQLEPSNHPTPHSALGFHNDDMPSPDRTAPALAAPILPTRPLQPSHHSYTPLELIQHGLLDPEYPPRHLAAYRPIPPSLLPPRLAPSSSRPGDLLPSDPAQASGPAGSSMPPPPRPNILPPDHPTFPFPQPAQAPTTQTQQDPEENRRPRIPRHQQPGRRDCDKRNGGNQ